MRFWTILLGRFASFTTLLKIFGSSKNNILLKNLTDVAIGTLGWWAFGWMLAYGNPDEDGDGKLDGDFAGSIQAFGSGFMEDKDGVVTPLGTRQLNWFFQWAFAATAATTVSGCMAERTCFAGYLIYSFCITSVIYATVVHWVWVRGSKSRSCLS